MPVVPKPWIDCGYAAILAELEATGKLSVPSCGAPFQMLPTTEPELFCEIWVIDVQ